MTVVLVGSNRIPKYPLSTIILNLLKDNWNFGGITSDFPQYVSNPLPIPFIFSKNDWQGNVDYQIRIADYDSDPDMKLGGGTNYNIQSIGRVLATCMVRKMSADNEIPIQIHNMVQRVKDIIRDHISNIGSGIVDSDIQTEANLLHSIRVEKGVNEIVQINRQNPYFDDTDISTYQSFWKTEVMIKVMYFLHVAEV